MVAVAGGRNRGELLVSVTRAPPGGALPFNAMDANAGLPPVITFGDGRSSFNEGGSIVIGIVAVDVPYFAVIVALVVAVTWP
jgi:hypothetical protein